MEENKNGKKVVRRIVKQPQENNKEVKSNSKTIKDILFYAMFFMVLVIFLRGFNVKKTIINESELTRSTVKELVIEELDLRFASEDAKREMLKNEILSAYALYSRLSATELKEKEEYHQELLEKWESVANTQVTKNDIINLEKELQELKDTTNDETKIK